MTSIDSLNIIFKKIQNTKISKDIFSVLSGRIFSSGLYFIFVMIIMSFLTVEEYGKYT